MFLYTIFWRRYGQKKGRKCSKNQALNLSEGFVQPAHNRLDAQSVRVACEHGKTLSTLLAALFHISIFLVFAFYPFQALAQDILTYQQPIDFLAKAQTIFLRLKVLQHGQEIAYPPSLFNLLTQRLTQVGYDVVTEKTAPHDVTVIFHCEIAHATSQPDHGKFPSPGRLPPPPCFFDYALQETPVKWQRIDLIVYNEGIEANTRLYRQVEGRLLSLNRFDRLHTFLEILDFPLLLSAEWGQVFRLTNLLKDPSTPSKRQQKILTLLGEIQAEDAFSLLTEMLSHPRLGVTAAQALGNFGARAQQPLLTTLHSHSDITMLATVVRSLGQIGAATGDTSLTPLYLEFLNRPDLDIRVKTEIVWAIGKSPDFSAHAALEALENQIWQIRSQDPDLQKLREAVDWSLREIRQGGHTGDYY